MLRKDDRLTKSVHQWNPTGKRYQKNDQMKGGWTVLKRIYDEHVYQGVDKKLGYR